VIASTYTNRDGSYSFDHLDLGSYTVEITHPRGLHQTATTPQTVELTRGGKVISIDFAITGISRNGYTGGLPGHWPGHWSRDLIGGF